MTGHNPENSIVEPIDDRDSDDPDFEIEPVLSSPDFDFSDEDPAALPESDTGPVEPAWNTEGFEA